MSLLRRIKNIWKLSGIEVTDEIEPEILKISRKILSPKAKVVELEDAIEKLEL